MTPRKMLRDARLNSKLPKEVKAKLQEQADENGLTLSTLVLVIFLRHINSPQGKGEIRFYENTRNTE